MKWIARITYHDKVSDKILKVTETSNNVGSIYKKIGGYLYKENVIELNLTRKP